MKFIRDQWNKVYEDNNITIRSIHNEGKSVVVKKFIASLKLKSITI